jgi:hypothetical protein
MAIQAWVTFPRMEEPEWSTLSQAQQGRAQTEEEAVTIIAMVTKFHKHLMRQKFTLVT